jgi:predicted ATPase
MSAITSTPAFLSAKARVTPGVSGARTAVARPAGARRVFVVRASAEQKKGACADVFSTLFAASRAARRLARASTPVRRDYERVDDASAAASPRSPRRFRSLRPPRRPRRRHLFHPATTTS